MRQLTKNQKLKIMDKLIKSFKADIGKGDYDSYGICTIYTYECKLFKIKGTETDLDNMRWAPRFFELNENIKSEIKRTGGVYYIRYKNWVKDRIALLKKVRKEVADGR